MKNAWKWNKLVQDQMKCFVLPAMIFSFCFCSHEKQKFLFWVDPQLIFWGEAGLLSSATDPKKKSVICSALITCSPSRMGNWTCDLLLQKSQASTIWTERPVSRSRAFILMGVKGPGFITTSKGSFLKYAKHMAQASTWSLIHFQVSGIQKFSFPMSPLQVCPSPLANTLWESEITATFHLARNTIIT